MLTRTGCSLVTNKMCFFSPWKSVFAYISRHFTQPITDGRPFCIKLIYCIYIAQIPYIMCSNAHYTIHIYTRASPFSFTISVLSSFTCITTTHGTYSFTSHPKDEAIMVKCLAQGHKRRNRTGRYSNPHSDNIRS